MFSLGYKAAALCALVSCVDYADAGTFPEHRGDNIGAAITAGSGSFSSAVCAPDGASDVPGYTFCSDTDTGLFRSGVNQVSITAGASEIARVNSTGLSIIAGQIMNRTESASIGLNVGTAGSAHLVVTDVSGAKVQMPLGFSVGASGATDLQHLSATASLDFGVIAGGACAGLTIAVTNAVNGDPVVQGIPTALANTANLIFDSWISAAGTATVRACCTLLAGSCVDPAAATVRVVVLQY